MFCFVKTEKINKKTNLTTTNAILNRIISLKEKKTKLFYILNNTKKTKSYVCILFKLCLAKIVCKKS